VPRPPREKKTGAAFDTDWARRYPARLARAALVDWLVVPAVRTVADLTVDGAERLDSLPGPVVFVANHHSHLDTSVLLGAIPSRFRHRTVVAAAADYFFANRVGGAAAALVLNAIPIERTKVNRRSAELASELLEDGWSILIFPEGGRSPDGWGQEFRGGAAYLSVKCGVPIVPIHLAGTDSILAKGMKRPQPGPVTVRFGNPMRPHEGEDARAFGPRVQAAVAALADEHATDWWSARKRAAQGTTPPLSGPATPAWRRAWALGDRRSRTFDHRERSWPW
jgi:1-acyl-sn-glycerol-3-phosphate acyltransferase